MLLARSFLLTYHNSWVYTFLFNIVLIWAFPIFKMSGQDKQSPMGRNPPGHPASASPPVQIPASDAYNSRGWI
jgi:hypothetical protein